MHYVGEWLVLVHAFYVQLPMRMQTSRRLLRLDGNVDALRPAKRPACRVSVVPKKILTVRMCVVIAVGAFCAHPHAEDVFANDEGGDLVILNPSTLAKPSRDKIARLSS